MPHADVPTKIVSSQHRTLILRSGLCLIGICVCANCGADVPMALCKDYVRLTMKVLQLLHALYMLVVDNQTSRETVQAREVPLLHALKYVGSGQPNIT